jgi:hypothetical protein
VIGIIQSVLQCPTLMESIPLVVCIECLNLVTSRVGVRTNVLAVSERGVAQRYNIKTGQHVAEGQP